MSLAESYVLAHYGPENFKLLIGNYISLSYLNLWIPFVFLIFSISIFFLIKFFETVFAPGSKKFAIPSVLLVLAAPLLFFGQGLADAMARYQGRVIERSSINKIGQIASLYNRINKRIATGDRVLISSTPIEIGPEKWIFSPPMDFAYQLYGSGESLFSYSLFWPPLKESVDQHFSNFCGPKACQTLHQHKIDWLIDFGSEICGTSFQNYIRSLSCVEEKFKIHVDDEKLNATGYRLNFSALNIKTD
ncbi:MAG: hypothetical protein EOO88_42090 [Pedobacter sp.]|nr:MAG: hypothetical protein EOO88_42090 [Pedobacter sp.]